MRPVAHMRKEVPGRQHRRCREAHMLGDHRGVMVAAAFEMDDQLLVGEPIRIDGLQRPVRLDRGRLGGLVPLAHLLAPKSPLEDFFSALETRRDLGFPTGSTSDMRNR